MRMPLTVWGIFTATVLALLAFPRFSQRYYDDAGQDSWHQLFHASTSVAWVSKLDTEAVARFFSTSILVFWPPGSLYCCASSFWHGLGLSQLPTRARISSATE